MHYVHCTQDSQQRVKQLAESRDAKKAELVLLRSSVKSAMSKMHDGRAEWPTFMEHFEAAAKQGKPSSSFFLHEIVSDMSMWKMCMLEDKLFA